MIVYCMLKTGYIFSFLLFPGGNVHKISNSFFLFSIDLLSDWKKTTNNFKRIILNRQKNLN